MSNLLNSGKSFHEISGESLYWSRKCIKTDTLFKKRLVKHPQFSTFCQKCRDFFRVILKTVGNLAGVKQLKNSIFGKDLVDPPDPRGRT